VAGRRTKRTLTNGRSYRGHSLGSSFEPGALACLCSMFSSRFSTRPSSSPASSRLSEQTNDPQVTTDKRRPFRARQRRVARPAEIRRATRGQEPTKSDQTAEQEQPVAETC
jgi:hypothetical protein